MSDAKKTKHQIIAERDNAIAILRRLLYATRPDAPPIACETMRKVAYAWMEKYGFHGSPLR